ncbi:MAG: hypothetical protein KAQ88_05405 [Hyphomicrobiaceae bacterium]|nr:hypothetical protein [Hyphomicrobiaceae bacterium]
MTTTSIPFFNLKWDTDGAACDESIGRARVMAAAIAQIAVKPARQIGGLEICSRIMSRTGVVMFEVQKYWSDAIGRVSDSQYGGVRAKLPVK